MITTVFSTAVVVEYTHPFKLRQDWHFGKGGAAGFCQCRSGTQLLNQSNAFLPEVIISSKEHGFSLGWFTLGVCRPQAPLQSKLVEEKRTDTWNTLVIIRQSDSSRFIYSSQNVFFSSQAQSIHDQYVCSSPYLCASGSFAFKKSKTPTASLEKIPASGWILRSRSRRGLHPT